MLELPRHRKGQGQAPLRESCCQLMLPTFTPSREMKPLQLKRVPIGSGTRTPTSSTAVSKMDSLRTLGFASTEAPFIVEELGKGTSSELNTPEVVCTDWKFQGQASHGRDHYATLMHDAFHSGEEPSKADLDPYSSFSSLSPLEQRMNLESFVSSHGCPSKGLCTGDEVGMYNIMLPIAEMDVTLAEPRAFEEESIGCDIFPCLGDKNHELPPDLVQLMEEILPSEKENVVNNSAEFDMIVGSQDPLAEAIKFTRILDDDPSWRDLDKEVTTINMDDIKLLDQEVMTPSIDDMELSDVVTLSPTSTSVHSIESAEVPSLPEHVEASPVPEEPVSVVTATRSKRKIKRPDRYQGTAPDFDASLELLEAAVPSPSAHTRRQRQSLTHMSEEEKYARIRKLNNEASKRCRTNKKTQMKNMAKEMELLSQDNERLKKKVQHLESLRDQMKDFVHNFFRDQMAAVKK